MKNVFVLLIGLVLSFTGLSHSCLPEGITFSTQEQIDSFQADYPDCTEIDGDVSIGDYGGVSDITDLSGLSLLNSIGGVLNIWFNDSLFNLTGMDNLSSIGRLQIMNNTALNSFTGLEALTSIVGDLFIRFNDALTSLTGLENVTSIGGNILISDNPVLADVDGLNNITTIDNNIAIYGNYALASLTGLSNLTYIGRSLNISQSNNLTTLSGLEGLTSIGEWLIIESNYNLTSLTGLENLTSVKGISIYVNPYLSSLTGLDGITHIQWSLSVIYNNALTCLTGLGNLTYIGEYLYIGDNNNLFSLSGLEDLAAIDGWLGIQGNDSLTGLAALNNLNSINGDLKINLNSSLTSLLGLDNIAAGSITNLTITNNNSLATCEVQSICNYLASPDGIVEIHNNATGCNNPPEVASGCDIHLPCLPYGNYYFHTQNDIDSFLTDYPDCTELEGDITISGSDITNLNGLSNVTDIGGALHINDNDTLANLTGLESLTSIGGTFYIDNNDMLTSFTGLENLTTVGNYLFIGNIEGNPVLNDLTELVNLTSIGGVLKIWANDALTSLSGLDNINARSINDLTIYYNNNLSSCEIKSVCDYLASPNSIIEVGSNLTGCNSDEEILAACEVGMDEKTKSESHINIYPNPASSNLIIELPYTTSIKNTCLTIFNINGKQLMRHQMTEQTTLINIGTIPPGIYFVQVADDRTVQMRKFVKQ